MHFLVSGEATVELAEPARKFLRRDGAVVRRPRSATVVATQPGVLLILDIADLRELAGRRPGLVDLIEAEARRRSEANARAGAPIPGRAPSPAA